MNKKMQKIKDASENLFQITQEEAIWLFGQLVIARNGLTEIAMHGYSPDRGAIIARKTLVQLDQDD